MLPAPVRTEIVADREAGRGGNLTVFLQLHRMQVQGLDVCPPGRTGAMASLLAKERDASSGKGSVLRVWLERAIATISRSLYQRRTWRKRSGG